MTMMERGSQGSNVADWQRFLGIQADGIFGDLTTKDTEEWQASHNLPATSIVDQDTLTMAESYGFTFSKAIPSKKGSFFPVKPNFSSPTDAERKKMFGTFSFKRKNSSDIIITGNWVEENIVDVIIPQLIGVEGAPKDGKIKFHKKGVEQLKGFFNELERQGYKDLIISWAGSFYPRYIRGSSTTLSNHSWGTAFDINAPWNWLAKTPAADGSKGSLLRLVPIANSFGFFWGGHYNSRLDGMHFELAVIGKFPDNYNKSAGGVVAPSVPSAGEGAGGDPVPAPTSNPTTVAPAPVLVQTEAIPVTQTKPAEDLPKEESFIDQIRSWYAALPAGIAAAGAAVWGTIKEVKVEIIVALIVSAALIVLLWVYNKQKSQRVKDQQEFELKRIREEQAHEITKLKIESAMDKGKNTIEVVPNPITNSDQAP